MSSQQPSPANNIPPLVVMARLGAPHGVRGWLRVLPHSAESDSLSRYSNWWCSPVGDSWRRCEISEIRPHGAKMLLKMERVDNCEDAAFWRHGKMAVARDELPPLADGQFYWFDLIGLKAFSTDGCLLGKVTGLMRVGENDVLRIKKADGEGEFLTPFIDDYVPSVDIAAGSLRVDWQPEW